MNNYPWSGRLGPIAKRCLYCGDDGPGYQISSRADACCRCMHSGAKPIPELLAEFDRERERLARAWCRDFGVDYEAAIAAAEQKGE